nr:hypothetical protein Iba_chr05cCG0630 [Ipomoea batatas]
MELAPAASAGMPLIISTEEQFRRSHCLKVEETPCTKVVGVWDILQQTRATSQCLMICSTLSFISPHAMQLLSSGDRNGSNFVDFIAGERDLQFIKIPRSVRKDEVAYLSVGESIGYVHIVKEPERFISHPPIGPKAKRFSCAHPPSSTQFNYRSAS